MNKKPNVPPTQTIGRPKFVTAWPFPKALFGGMVTAALLGCYWSRAQTAPGLTIAKTGTNEISISITNAVLTDSYELWWTPVLGNPSDFPYAIAAVGNIGQTNFSLSMNGLQTGFFYAYVDPNAIPLWEAADPNNQATGILKVTIANPTNGMTLN